MAGVDSSFQVLYTGEVPTTPIRLGQLLVNESLPGSPLQQCTSLSPLTYTTIGGFDTAANYTLTGSWTFTLTTTFGNPATITLGNTGTNSTNARSDRARVTRRQASWAPSALRATPSMALQWAT